MTWEKVDEQTCRAKIHKGWLVKHYDQVFTMDRGHTECISQANNFAICFVPDPMHVWTISG